MNIELEPAVEFFVGLQGGGSCRFWLLLPNTAALIIRLFCCLQEPEHECFYRWHYSVDDSSEDYHVANVTKPKLVKILVYTNHQDINYS